MTMPEVQKLLIGEIVVRPNRVRKDLGDIAGLAANIEKSGFIPPILVASITYELIDGLRRLEAAKLLGWKQVPVAVVPIQQIAEGEIVAQNQKPYTWAEKIAIYKAVQPLFADEAGERQRSGLRRGGEAPAPVRENRPHGKPGRTRDRVAAFLGDISGKTLEQAVAVFESEYDDLKSEIERKGKVSRAYRNLLRRQRVEELQAAPAPDNRSLHLGDCREVLAGLADNTFDAVISDPPFGIGYEYGDGVEETCTPEDYGAYIVPIFRELVRVVRPGGLVALWQSRKYVRHFWDWFGLDIRLYFACHGHVNWRNEVMADAVDPVVFYWKPGADPVRPARPHGSKNFHVSTVLHDELAKRHPCPRPLDVCEHILQNFVPEGGYIFDGFAGSGSILVAAERLGHPWMGVERNSEYRQVALKRLEVYGRTGSEETDTGG
jgi:adenine-specific DNA-methyltransferase